MSGLAGIVTFDGRPVGGDRLERMAAAAPYLGPDGITTWHSGPAGLVFCKLATTPEAVAEKQPLIDENEKLALCFDGRLDNRDELLADLRNRGWARREAADSEIVLELFKRRGNNCQDAMVGDYALAVWDWGARHLFAARSPCGWRPFLWYCDNFVFAFATEFRQLVDGVPIARQANEPAIAEWLSVRFVTPTETLWKNIYRLQPGWALEVKGGPPRLWRWHQGPFPDGKLPSEEAYAERFNFLFDQAVDACLRSQVPVAAQLSGGLDSSAVVCRAVERFRAQQVAHLVQPITTVFPGEAYDESEWVGAVESHITMNSERVVASTYDWEWARDWSTQTLHLPLRPNAAAMNIKLCQKLREAGTRVLLTGEGGDDWLGGSDSLANWPDLLRRGQLLQLLREGIARQPGRPLWRSLLSIGANSVGPWVLPARRNALFRAHLGPDLGVRDWIRPEWAERISLLGRLHPNEQAPPLSGFVQCQRYTKFGRALSHVNLDNVIAYTAMQQVELRHPFHDRRLSQFLMGVPGQLLLRGNERKYLLRVAMRGTLPEVVRTRQSKATFSATVVDALEQILTPRSILRIAPVEAGWVDGGRLWEIFQSWRDWRDRGADRPTSPLGAVWNAFAADILLRHAAGT